MGALLGLGLARSSGNQVKGIPVQMTAVVFGGFELDINRVAGRSIASVYRKDVLKAFVVPG